MAYPLAQSRCQAIYAPIGQRPRARCATLPTRRRGKTRCSLGADTSKTARAAVPSDVRYACIIQSIRSLCTKADEHVLCRTFFQGLRLYAQSKSDRGYAASRRAIFHIIPPIDTLASNHTLSLHHASGRNAGTTHVRTWRCQQASVPATLTAGCSSAHHQPQQIIVGNSLYD